MLFFSVVGAEAVENSVDSSLGKAVNRYRKANAIQMNVKKDVFMHLLDKRLHSVGSLKISKGRFRLKFQKPQEFLMVLDKKYLWIESNDSEFNIRQVIRTKYTKVYAHSGGLIAILFGGDQFLNDLDVKKVQTKGNEITYELVPKKRSRIKNIKEIVILINRKAKLIKSISYVSKIGNKTSYAFSKIEFKKGFSDKIFEYKIPKGVEVIDLK